MSGFLTLIAGCGYLGTVLARLLLADGCPVLALTRHRESAQELERQGIPALACDLADPDAVAALSTVCRPAADKPGPRGTLPDKAGSGGGSGTGFYVPLRIVHCAAGGRGGTAEDYRAIHLEGGRNLRTIFPDAARYLHTSSSSVYPQIAGELVTEDSPAHPLRETGRILRAAEDEALAAGGIVARLAGLYGPGRSVLLRNFLDGKAAVEVRSDPPSAPDGRWINQIHVADAACALRHLLDRPDLPAASAGRIWNVVDSTPMTQRQFYRKLARRFGCPAPPDAAPDFGRKRGWTHKRVSNERLLASGWKPQYPSWFDALEHDPAFLPSIGETRGQG